MSQNGTERLPSSWARVRIDEVCEILAGYGFPKSLQGKTEGEIPFFKVGDISEAWKRKQVYLGRAQHYLSLKEAKEIRAKPLPIDTTVFAKIGAAIALNRRAILARPSLVDNNVMGLSPNAAAVNPSYLFHFVCTLKLDELSRATAVPSLRGSDVAVIGLPLPPLPEQHRIVAEIEKQFTRLDAGVATLERARANLKRYRASVLKAACEGCLVPTEAELARAEGRDYEPADRLLAHILKERRAKWEADRLTKMQAQDKIPKNGKWKEKYQEPSRQGIADLPELPEGWVWASPEQLASSEDYSLAIGPFGSNLKVSDYTDEGVPLVFVRNIRSHTFGGDSTNYISQEKADELRPHWVSPGDILITKMGDPPGDACLYPDGQPTAVITADCIKFRPCGVLSFPTYFVSTINSQGVRSQILGITKGVAQLKVSLARFKTIGLPLPPLAEQSRIVAEVERRLSVIDELEATVAANLKRAERLRQSILKRAFEGKLVPQDPNDEPASMLLEHIRAERQVEQKATAKAIGRPSQKSKRSQVAETQAELFR